jgi:MFS family permease
VRVLARGDFRRLFAVRLAGQFGDGIFQASLAGAVLFNPERQAHAADIAAGFAVILLPYSLVGPFAGVLLDRWSRQRVLAVANLLRAAAVCGLAAEVAVGVHGQPFYASALVVISVNRFILAALSAALPHVVESDELVTANALSTTAGALATTAGGGAAIALHVPLGSSNTAYAVISLVAALPYLAAATVASTFCRDALGPDAVERARRRTVAAVVSGFVDGARHIARQRAVRSALAMIAATRFCYGISTVAILLLYRNYFRENGFFRAGLSGLAQVIVMLAVGAGLAAVVSPAAIRQLGFVRWPVTLLALAAVVEVGLGLPYSMPLLLLVALGLGFAAQGIKITVDTLVQRLVADDFRGRVFSFYDTVFNVAFVAAAVVAAVALPDSGRSPAAVIAIGVGYAITAAAYLRGAVGEPLAEQAVR